MHVTLAMCVCAGLACLAYMPVSASGISANALMMFVVGLMIAGPDSVLGGVGCADVCDAAGTLCSWS